MDHNYLADRIDLGVLDVPGGPRIILCGWNHTDGWSVERNNFIAALSITEQHVDENHEFRRGARRGSRDILKGL